MLVLVDDTGLQLGFKLTAGPGGSAKSRCEEKKSDLNELNRVNNDPCGYRAGAPIGSREL